MKIELRVERLYSCPKHWRLSASWQPNWGPSETPRTSQHYHIEWCKRGPSFSPIMPRDASLRQPMWDFPVRYPINILRWLSHGWELVILDIWRVIQTWLLTWSPLNSTQPTSSLYPYPCVKKYPTSIQLIPMASHSANPALPKSWNQWNGWNNYNIRFFFL